MNIRKTFAVVAAAGLLAAGLACGDEPAAAPPTATPKAWPTRDPGTVRETRTALATRRAVTTTPTLPPNVVENLEVCEEVLGEIQAGRNDGYTIEEIAYGLGKTVDFTIRFVVACVALQEKYAR